MVDLDQWEAARISAPADAALSEGFCPRCLEPLAEPILSVDPLASDTLTAAMATTCPRGHVYLLHVWTEPHPD